MGSDSGAIIHADSGRRKHLPSQGDLDFFSTTFESQKGAAPASLSLCPRLLSPLLRSGTSDLVYGKDQLRELLL